MDKKAILACAFVMTVVGTAQAADSVDLKVTGKLVKGSCAPALENGGVVDFGNIPLENLSKTNVNQLGRRNINLTITCDTAIPVAWQAVDNKHTSVQDISVTNGLYDGSACFASDNHFGLGKTAGNVNIGDYCVIVNKDAMTVDGVKAVFTQTNYKVSNGAWSTLSGGDVLNGVNGQWRYISASEEGSTAPVPGKVFVYPLVISAAVQGTDTLAVTDNTPLDGSATISLVYL
ncbi:DUF1120 domain-containing protein [Cronobacter turicensis]|uniref:DUF1120 domain-containing protein n=1 Tax=Cronobacter turicensis TaxID=413502 RepID=UPI0011ADEB9B|nr:DUF1120 domain-containing protein [Cronobacter turicensis]TWR36691.1 DUF1120 domain-containing protein [Cronobacter turicensis]